MARIRCTRKYPVPDSKRFRQASRTCITERYPRIYELPDDVLAHIAAMYVTALKQFVRAWWQLEWANFLRGGRCVRVFANGVHEFREGGSAWWVRFEGTVATEAFDVQNGRPLDRRHHPVCHSEGVVAFRSAEWRLPRALSRAPLSYRQSSPDMYTPVSR